MTHNNQDSFSRGVYSFINEEINIEEPLIYFNQDQKLYYESSQKNQIQDQEKQYLQHQEDEFIQQIQIFIDDEDKIEMGGGNQRRKYSIKKNIRRRKQ